MTLKSKCLFFLAFIIFTTLSMATAQLQDEVVIQINGMFCPFCTYGIEKHFKKLPEAASVRTNLAAGKAIVTLKAGEIFFEDHFTKAIKKAGFTYAGITLRAALPPRIQSNDKPDITYGSNHELHTTGNPGFTFGKIIGKAGSKPGEFKHPISIAFAKDGSFIIADGGNHRIQRFDRSGSPTREWSVSGDGETLLENPVDVAVAPNGELWVTDYDSDTISHYQADGSPTGMFGHPGSDPGNFNAPSGITVIQDSLIAVSEFYNHRIQFLDMQGNFVNMIGSDSPWRRIPPRGLNYPTRVTQSPNGMLWVADAYNYRVLAFDRKGKVIRKFGKKGTRPGKFNVTGGIAILPDRRLAVCDLLNHRIQIWSSNGIFIGDFGSQGIGQGELERPTDVALAPNGDLYVVDWGNHRVQVFTKKGGAR